MSRPLTLTLATPSVAASFALVVLGACGGRGPGTTSASPGDPEDAPPGALGDGGQRDDGRTGSTCPDTLAAGFTPTPGSFSLPAARCQTPFASLAASLGVGFTTTDLGGDGVPDLVVYRDDCDRTVGENHWDVYAGSSSGFAATPASFSLPTARCRTRFDSLAGTASVGFVTMDLTGDGILDFVVYRDDCDATVGATHWDVYPGSRSGFAASPRSFSIPAARCRTAFDALAATSAVGFATTDLTADGVPDLVVYRDDCEPQVGATRWDVYAGSSSGFAASPTPFSIPAARCKTAFNALVRSSATGFATMDLTADGVPDLVVYRDDCDTEIGATHWDVYAGSSSGFAATPASFAVPAARCRTSFDAPVKSSALAFTTTDLTGSGRPALVVARDDCDATVGKDHWDVYPASASGFASRPFPFGIPSARCNVAFDALGSNRAIRFDVLRLTNRCAVDLVVEHDDCDASVGKSRWDAYRAQ
jgi:hypothetical protein